MNKKVKLCLIVFLATLLIAVLGVFTACSNPTFDYQVEGLHEGQALPEVTSSQSGTVTWVGDKVLKAGTHNYTFRFVDAFGKKLEYTIQLTASEHKTDEQHVTIVKEPECNVEGITRHLCSICQEEFSWESIPPLGHDYSVNTHVDGDCQHPGYHTVNCARCNTAKLDENNEIYKKYDDNLGPHNYQKDDIQLGTCVAFGTFKYKCQLCGEYECDDDGNVIVHEDGKYGNHVYETDPISGREITYTIKHSTCMEGGLGEIRCILCEEGTEGHTVTVHLEKTNHSFVEQKYTEGDCHHYGYTEYTCAYKCGTLLLDENGEIYREIDAEFGEHKYVDGFCVVKYEDEFGLTQICGAADVDNAIIKFNLGANAKGTNPTDRVVASLIPREEMEDGNIYYDMFIEGEGGVYQHWQSHEAFPWYKLDTFEPNNEGLYLSNLVKTVVIQDGVTDLAEHMFQNFAQLEKVTLCTTLGNGGAATIPAYCFSGSTRLETINNLPQNITVIDTEAFYNCSLLNLNTFGLPQDLVEIGDRAFAYNNKLLFVDFRQSPNLQKVGHNAFRDCPSLAYVVMPSYLRDLDIGGGCFLNNETIIYIEDVYGTGWESMDIFSTAYVYYLGTTSPTAFEDMVKIHANMLQLIHNPNGYEITLSYRDVSGEPVKYTANGNVITRAIRFTDEAINTSEIRTLDGLLGQQLSDGSSFGDNLQMLGPECFAMTVFDVAFNIPSTVKVIGDLAFSNATIKGLTIPDDTQLTALGRNVFYGSTVRGAINVYLPSTLETVYSGTFAGKTFGKIVVDMKNIPGGTNTGGSYLFTLSGKIGKFQSLTLGPNVETIGDYAFAGIDHITTWTSVVIPQNVTAIGKGAFKGCGYLAEITLPNQPIKIGADAFTGTACATSSTQNGVTIIGSHLIKATGLTGTYNIPEGIITLADEAFLGCTELSVTLPSTLEHIGERALEGVTILGDAEENYVGTKLVAVNKPDATYVVTYGTTHILPNAFEGLSTLETVVLPDTLVAIGSNAFYQCANLKEVKFVDKDGNPTTSKVQSIGEYAFDGCTSLTNFDFGENLTSLSEGSFRGSGLTSATLPASVQAIPDWCFAACKDMTAFNTGDGVVSLGNFSFSACEALEELRVGKNVTTISRYAFNEFELKRLYISDLKNWVNISFSQGNGVPGYVTPEPYTNNPALTSNYLVDYYLNGALLENLTIDNTISKIGSYAFGNCKSLKSVTFNADNVVLGSRVFSRCYFLKTANITKESWTKIEDANELQTTVWQEIVPSFFGDGSNVTINVAMSEDETVAVTGQKTFNIYDTDLYSITQTGTDEKGNKLYSVVINEGIIVIPPECLQKYCGAIDGYVTSITIPFSVTTISDHAFDGGEKHAENMWKIENVVITDTDEKPSQLTKIGERAFFGIGAKTINIPSTVKYVGIEAFGATYSLEKIFIKDIDAWCDIQFHLQPGNASHSGFTSNPLALGNASLYLLDDIGNYNLVEEVTITNKSVGDYAFYNYTQLKKVTLQPTVITIGNRAFQYCDGLSEVYIKSAENSAERELVLGNFTFDRTTTTPLSIWVQPDEYSISVEYLASNGGTNNTMFWGSVMSWPTEEVTNG